MGISLSTNAGQCPKLHQPFFSDSAGGERLDFHFQDVFFIQQRGLPGPSRRWSQGQRSCLLTVYRTFCFDMEPCLEHERIFFNMIGRKDQAGFWFFLILIWHFFNGCFHFWPDSFFSCQFKIGREWWTWIDYNRFQELIQEYEDSGGSKTFSAKDYMARTPQWALFGASERGFDPKDTRYQRKNKAKDISGCWDYLNVGSWRTQTNGLRRFSDSTVIFLRTMTQMISHTEKNKEEHGDTTHTAGLRRRHPTLWVAGAQPHHFFTELSPFSEFTFERKWFWGGCTQSLLEFNWVWD